MKTIYFSIISYGLTLFGLRLIPEHFWDTLLNWQQHLIVYCNQLKKKLPLLGEIGKGEDLLLSLSDSEAKITRGLKILPNVLCRYKFYTELLEQLFEAHRRLGIGVKKFIPEIRKALIKDLQFEKKILDEIIGAFLQFLVIAVTTWSFVLLSSSLVTIHPNHNIFILMSLLQIMGVFVFYQLLIKLKNKTFFKFSLAIQELYLFSTLLEVGIPLNEILLKSNILQGSLGEHRLFSPLAMRVKKLLDRLKETGLSPREEVEEVISSIWQLQEENFGKFTKKVQVLKFSILAFFFLPAYFLYLYSIFKFFMEQ
jgi:hypothetical protein